MPTYDWVHWLKDWNRALLDHLDTEEFFKYTQPEEEMTPEIAASGWLGYPPAAEAEIVQLETRLGVRLPESYRQFLQVSNGFRQPGNLVPRLFHCDEVQWFRVRNQETIDIWRSPHYFDPTTAEPDSFEMCLPDALEISACEIVGTAVYLLNPRVVNEDGEWEAFYLAHWIPGANRYDSFWDLMQKEYKSFLSFFQSDE